MGLGIAHMPAEPKPRAVAAKQGAVVVGLAVRAHRCGTNERDFQILNNVILVRWLRVALAHTGCSAFRCRERERVRPRRAARDVSGKSVPFCGAIGGWVSTVGDSRRW